MAKIKNNIKFTLLHTKGYKYSIKFITNVI